MKYDVNTAFPKIPRVSARNPQRQTQEVPICFSHGETVEHLVAGCRVLANSEYLTRRNRALMILAVSWAKEYELIGEDTVWYKKGEIEVQYWKIVKTN